MVAQKTTALDYLGILVGARRQL